MADDMPTVPGMQIDPALVRELAQLLDDTRLTEIEVQDGERRIRVARTAPVTMHSMAPAMAASAAALAPAAAAPAAPADAAPGDHPGTVKSPMVGTAYLAAEPGSKQFAAVGDTIAAGATLLIVEAMKVMNPIVSPRAGTIRAVFVQNGQPVEFDQPLIVVD